jgi:nucleoredoxin
LICRADKPITRLVKRHAVIWLLSGSSLFAQGSLSLEQIAGDPGLWPAEVMVVVDHKLPVVKDGKTARTLKVGPGHMYRVKSVDADGVILHGLGSTLTFKADDTDLIPRAEQLKALRDAPPPPPAAPPPATAQNAKPSKESAPPAAAPPPPAKRSAETNVFSSLLAGQLVSDANGSLVSYDAARLGSKKYVAVYFSASWCPPCRRFTPELVSWYNQMKRTTDDFELIFVSRDRDAGAMQSYMLEDRMPWPAISFNRKENNPLLKYSGRGIPNLVVLSNNGSVLSNSFENGEYLGPHKPLRDLEKLLNGR